MRFFGLVGLTFGVFSEEWNTVLTGPKKIANNGYNRYLFRRAMDSIMADEVRWNRRRGRQAVDIGYRIQAHWDETYAALEDGGRSDPVQKYLDVPRMKEILFRLRERVDRATTAESGMILLRGPGVRLFLRRFDGERSPDAGNRF